jgi:hypothetical protein
MSPDDAVRSISNRDQTRSFDQFGFPKAGRGDRRYAVVIAVKNQGRHVDVLEIFAESSCQLDTQARVAAAEAPAATFQLAWMVCSLTRLPSSRSVL